MPPIIVEGPIQKWFEAAGEPVEVATPDGRVLGLFTPAPSLPDGDHQPAMDPLSLMNE
jgi:hypothetical protein